MMKRVGYTFLFALIILFGFSAFDRASATLIFDSQIDITGTGLGAVNTVLTIQHSGTATTDQGCVGRSLVGCPLGTSSPTPSDSGRIIGGTLGGDEQRGNAQTKTIPVGGLTGSTLLIVFNPSEPGPIGGPNNSITLNTLVLTIYNGTTSAIKFTALCGPCPKTFAATDFGVGKSGFVFKLDATEAGQFASAGIVSTDRIGLSASESNVQGGLETFFVASSVTGVPEPSSLLLLGSGLAGLGLAARLRKRVS